MKKMKFVLSFFAFFLFVGAGFSQSQKMIEKAEKQVEKLNSQIVAGDASLALNEEQTEKITELYTKMFTGLKEIRKSGLEGEELKTKQKALRKEINKEIFKNVLTKEQRLAKKAAKEAAKG